MATGGKLFEVIHPGEVLLEEFMKPMGISINQPSYDLRIAQRTIGSEVERRVQRRAIDGADRELIL